MGFTGNPGEVKAYAKRLAHLAANSKYIAKGAAPKIEKLVHATMRAGTDPYGAPHIPMKAGGPALSAAISRAGDITVRVERSGKAIKTVIAGILRFHDDGTKTGGRKTQQAIRASVKAGAGEFKPAEVLSKKRWKAAGGTDATFKNYKDEAKAQNKFAKAQHRDRIRTQTATEIRAARGRVWDPERPLIPNDAQGIPKPWSDAVLESAVVLLDQVGAEKKG